MGFIDELQAGKCAIYGQWAGWISSICKQRFNSVLLVFGIPALFSVPIFAIFAM
jgi:hypothetical protein